jgi:hypothetical protein
MDTQRLSQRITLPSLKIYYIHTSQACWRGAATSIYNAYILARKDGVRGHLYEIY